MFGVALTVYFWRVLARPLSPYLRLPLSSLSSGASLVSSLSRSLPLDQTLSSIDPYKVALGHGFTPETYENKKQQK